MNITAFNARFKLETAGLKLYKKDQNINPRFVILVEKLGNLK